MRSVNKRHTQNKGMCLHKASLLGLCLFLIVAFVVGGTVAYVFTKTSNVENTFVVPEYDVNIDEDFPDDRTIKKDVAIEVTGDMEVYVRASILISWKDEAGNILATTPVGSENEANGSDYQIVWGDSSNWFKARDGFYYYKLPVQGTIVKNADGTINGTLTDILIKECYPLKAAPKEGYFLSVDILSQVIQTTPVEAVATAWGVTVNSDRTISKELSADNTKAE